MNEQTPVRFISAKRQSGSSPLLMHVLELAWICVCGTEFITLEEWFAHSKQLNQPLHDEVILTGRSK